ncbi:MAG: zf-HC2 domain-containing protein, partial [Chrysiogenetes bacterium]|nr:zf-HC2 domain-containing protein [Chrysiogenetes bacterium]
MNCQETRRYLLAHLDGELDAKTSFDVQDHLEGCAACAAEAKAVARESEQLVRALAGPDAPVNELERRIEHALIGAEREERRAGRKLFFRSGLALAASVVLALGLYFSLGQPALLHAADYVGQHHHCIHIIFAGEDDHDRTEHEDELDRALVPEPVEARLTRTG